MSILGDYHNATVVALKAATDRPDFVDESGTQYDASTDLAIDLLVESGYQPGDNDALGVDVQDEVQTLLTLALFRAPMLRATVESIISQTR